MNRAMKIGMTILVFILLSCNIFAQVQVKNQDLNKDKSSGVVITNNNEGKTDTTQHKRAVIKRTPIRTLAINTSNGTKQIVGFNYGHNKIMNKTIMQGKDSTNFNTNK
jgi:hypothetical protein